MPLDPTRGRCPLDSRQGRCPWIPRRAFGPLDTRAGIPLRGFSFAGVTARDGRAATRRLMLFSHNTILILNDYKDTVRRFPKGDRKALWSPPQRRNLLAAYKDMIIKIGMCI